MNTKSIPAIIERASDGYYSICMDDDSLDYLVTGTGKTVEEAKRVFLGGYEDMKRFYAEQGKPFQEVTFTFMYDTASFLSYYSKVMSLAGLSRLTGINQFQLSHYLTGRRHPSARTTARMQQAIRGFADELSTVKLV